MSLYDKFGIIENHITVSQSQVTSAIDNYLENLLGSDSRVIMPDYINQAIWFRKIDNSTLISNIEQHLKTFLIQRRNQLRTFIKKDSFELVGLNKFIGVFTQKLEFVNNILRLQDSKLMEIGIHQLSNLVISDSIILLFIEENITNFDTNSELTKLLTTINAISKYDDRKTMTMLLKTFGNIYKKQLVNSTNIPLPDNIKRLYKLNEAIQYYDKILLFYSSINDSEGSISIICSPTVQLIFEYLEDIIKHCAINEIDHAFNSTHTDIRKIILTNFDNKETIVKKLSDEIVLLVDKSVKDKSCKYLKIINVMSLADSIIKSQDYKDIIVRKLGTLLQSDKVLADIHSDIDTLIRNRQIEPVIKIVEIVSNLKDKDIFINKYSQHLINRLLENISTIIPGNTGEYSTEEYFTKVIEFEKSILQVLKNKFGDKAVYRISKIITDTQYTFNDYLDFNRLARDNVLMTVTTSYSNWDINQTEGAVSHDIVEALDSNSIIGKYLKNYQRYYALRYSNKRKLNWYPHFGEVDITFLDRNIKLLPIQFMVLELFSSNSIVSIGFVEKQPFFRNYTTKFKSDVIKSLVTSKLLYYRNNNLILTTTSDFKENPIEIFFTVSDYAEIWEQKRDEELIHSREEITKANINQCVKVERLKVDDLYTTVKKKIQVFDLDHGMFEKSIKEMITMDYIRVVDGVVEKIYY